jgi:hypothetical protein
MRKKLTIIYPSFSSQELVGKYTHIENYFMREGLTKVTDITS